MKKGNALIEFVLILPIIVYMIMFCFDYAKISSKKEKLTLLLYDVVEMYNDGKTIGEMEEYIDKNIKDSSLIISNSNNEYITLTISHKTSYLTPGFTKIIKDGKNIEVNWVIHNKSNENK